MGTSVETLASALTPLLAAQDFDLYDVEMGKGLVKVTLTKSGGITLDQLADGNRIISAYLDEHEPFERRYTLEVSSPGVERTLRTPAHFAAALGESVKVKTAPEVVADRRVDGILSSVDANGIEIRTAQGDVIALNYDDIERARTTFAWGASAKPSPSRGGAPQGSRRSTPPTPERITTP